MNHPTSPNGPGAAFSPRAHDPLAVAIGNASLLNVGYLMLGRRRTALVTGVITLLILAVRVWATPSAWTSAVVPLWWAFLTGHGWLLASVHEHRPRRTVRGQRIIAFGFAVSVLLAVGFARGDLAKIDRAVSDARSRGDCARALTAQREVWLGHRLADAPVAARIDRTAQACRRLRMAGTSLSSGLTGDPVALKAGFDGLASVLKEHPGHEKMVEAALDGFLTRLPTKDACATAVVTDWLRSLRTSHRILDRSTNVVARTAPAALTGCGDALMTDGKWEKAHARYQQLLDQYPGNELAAKAKDGVRRATLAGELANIWKLLQEPAGADLADEPEYCSKPAKYSGAAPYRRGINRVLFTGDTEYTRKLPKKWRTSDAAKAVLIACVGSAEHGKAVRTCHYDNPSSLSIPSPPGSPFPSDHTSEVTFYTIVLPMKVYELRTGRLVAKKKLRIGGKSCPPTIEYTYRIADLGPPSEMFVKASKADIRDAFEPLITGRW